MTFINRNNMYKQRSFTSGVIGNIEAEIDRYRSILSNPASISTLEDYNVECNQVLTPLRQKL